jgi:hypothetical protein
MLVEGLHAVEAALGDDRGEVAGALGVGDGLGGAAGVDHDLEDGDAAAVAGPADQALADNAAQGRGQGVLEGLGVADLADQDDVGVLAHGGRMAMVTSSVSARTSRWLTVPSLSACRTSMRSLIVTIWTAGLALTWSIMAARVVVLPEPVGPVTSTRPRGCSARRAIAGARPSSPMDIAPSWARRGTSPTGPRWRKASTRNRPTPGSE